MVTERGRTEADGARRRYGPAVRRTLRPRPGERIVRWIGASGRRRARPASDASVEPPLALKDAANVVRLTWARTFGRVTRGMAMGAHGGGVIVGLGDALAALQRDLLARG